jgi:hypothetical protein
MSLMIRGSLPMMQYKTLPEGIARGRMGLIQTTGQDFGYDLRAWHNYLIETEAGGYKWAGGHRRYAKEIEGAMANDQWLRSVDSAETESLLERLTEQEDRQRAAHERAEREWAGKLRCCPKCAIEFRSVRDRGQCPRCGHIFYASHPMLGNVMWWLQI